MQSTYNAWLVTLSIGVAILVSFTSLRLAARVAESQGSAGRAWLILGATSMGVGIWSMHFIGMLSFSLPITLRYDIGPTLISLGIAIVTSGFAIRIASRSTLGLIRHVMCSVIMGLGIVAMHYTGMRAIPIVPAITYDPALVAASIAIAVSASFAALWLTFNMRRETRRYATLARLGSAVIMGLAIAGMHYTAMAASVFQRGAFCRGGVALDNTWLAILIAVASLALLVVTLITSIFDAQLASRARHHAQRLQLANERLTYQSTHDGLTDLPNRTLFIDRLQQAINESTDTRLVLGVMLVDLDRFKIVNDSLGHGAGDSILKEVAERLTESIGDSGVVARLGGDEFLVMVEVADARTVAQTAHRIVGRLSELYQADDVELSLAVSVGITTYPFDNSEPEVLISHADEVMYDVKRDGGNGMRFFVPGTTLFTIERLQLDSDLRRAAERGQLRLHYQPLVDVASGSVRGLEALVRWQHPARGWIAPGDFIPLAEASDAIVAIGRWVLEEACRQARAWIDEGFDLFIAVNLSARQFRQPDLLTMIEQAMARNGLEPHHLVIELTESVVMSYTDRSIDTLDELHRRGLQIAVDDFGTGYSSMGYLKRLPVSKLKIDRTFVNDLGSDAKDESIVKAIIALAHGLGMKVVAEGVETFTQLSRLRSFGCDQYQGYLYSRPINGADVSALLRPVAQMATAAGGGSTIIK